MKLLRLIDKGDLKESKKKDKTGESKTDCHSNPLIPPTCTHYYPLLCEFKENLTKKYSYKIKLSGFKISRESVKTFQSSKPETPHLSLIERAL